MERTILHSDLNNFYASVECQFDPSLRGRPVAVCGSVEDRHGIVLAKNELAKKYGVLTGQAVWQAQRLCPDLTVVPPHYDRYLSYSRYVTDIYRKYTDQVEHFGLDECWLDVSGNRLLHGEGEKIAQDIRKKIKRDLCVTVSIGVSYNKIFAKLGSDLKKPDAVTVITRQNFKTTVWPLPVSALLYIGPATTRKLHRIGIDTIGGLARMDLSVIQRYLGKIGVTLWLFANGLDCAPVARFGDQPIIKSIGNSTTAPRDLTSENDIKITLYTLCESVAARLRENGFLCRTVQITVKDFELFSYTRRSTLHTPSNLSRDLFKGAFSLYRTHHTSHRPVRNLGIRACNLVPDHAVQMTLFDDFKRAESNLKLEQALDSIRARFGNQSIVRGIMLTDPDLSAVDPKADHVIHPVSYFR